MTPETTEALLASIDAWYAKYDATDPNEFTCTGENCPLCQTHRHCAGCPIAIATDNITCMGTPWLDAHVARNTWWDTFNSNQFGHGASLYDVEFARGQFRYHARRMIVFMERLVPREAWMGVR